MRRGPRHHFRTLQRERYDSRKFVNPLFRKSEGKLRPWKRIALAVFAFAIPLAGAAFVLASPRFDLTDVSVTGTTSVSPDEVKAKAEAYLDGPFLLVFHHRNRFLFNEGDLKRAIGASFAFDRVDVTRTGLSLTIAVQEKVPRLVWQSGAKWYLVDGIGCIIRETSKDEVDHADPSAPLPRFLDVNHKAVDVGVSVLSKDEAKNALTFEDLLRAQDILFGTTKVDRLAGEWMSLETSDGFAVLFDPLADVAREAADLDAVLRDKVKDRSALSYVDVRFGDHVYFK